MSFPQSWPSSYAYGLCCLCPAPWVVVSAIFVPRYLNKTRYDEHIPPYTRQWCTTVNTHRIRNGQHSREGRGTCWPSLWGPASKDRVHLRWCFLLTFPCLHPSTPLLLGLWAYPAPWYQSPRRAVNRRILILSLCTMAWHWHTSSFAGLWHRHGPCR